MFYNCKYTTKNIILLFSVLFLVNINIYAQKKYTVVLDAGHGGKDPGAYKNKRIEKKIALSVVLKTGALLKDKKNIKVIYTRKKDVFVELHKRASIANKNNADLFVSVHCNANNKSHPHGSETYVLGLRGNAKNMYIAKRENAVIALEADYKKNYNYDPNAPESVIGLSVLQEENLDDSVSFAGLVQQNFAKAEREDRSVQQANFLVLRETIMPSVLIELGFLTNKKEGAFLNSEKGQNVMAKSIANAIIDYVNYLEENTISVNPEPKIKKSKKTEKPIKSKVKIPTGKGYKYSIQIAASKIYKKNDTKRFKGLKNVRIQKIGSFYTYLYGVTSDYNTAKKILKKVEKTGVKDAFIITFKNGKRVYR